MPAASLSWKQPEYWEAAKRHILAHDAVLGKIITAYGQEQLRSRGDAFETLARAIVGQQISVKAAESVWRKLEQGIGHVSPETVHSASAELLRSLGLSSQKTVYLNGIAEAFLQQLVMPGSWQDATDGDIIRELTALKGVGRWTAEMFLIFYLMKPDVLPLADIGLQKAIERHYNQGKKLTIHEMDTIAEPWRPYRTVATWYLWRSLDPVPVEY